MVTRVIDKFTINGFTDALVFVDQADRDQYTDEQIAAMKQARYDAWVAHVASVSAPEAE